MKELMKTKPLDKIRVTEICRVAEIERPTFYYHFKDKYDLVAWIFLSDAYDDVSQNALWQYMLEYFVKRYELIAKEKLNTDVLDTQLKYTIRLYCYDCVGMTREWLLNDNTTSAETVVQMMFASMPNDMRSIFFDKNAVHK